MFPEGNGLGEIVLDQETRRKRDNLAQLILSQAFRP